MRRGERSLSIWRLLVLLIAIGVTTSGSLFAASVHHKDQSTSSSTPWFGSYVDVTATPTYSFDSLSNGSNKEALLSFIVASSANSCSPSWGSAYSLDQAGNSLDLDRRIARLKQQGGHVAVSFGGQRNHEMAVNCTDETKLYQAYSDVVNRYDVTTIDLDIEGSDLTNMPAAARRASALAKLQADRRHEGKKLAIWLTLPVAPQGLTPEGTDAVSALLSKKVDLAGVNVMTMDYGQSKDANQSMESASESALSQTNRQLSILYQNAGVHLNSATVWSKIGATPMIGQNDVAKEIFTMADARGFSKFVNNHGLGRVSMWSANRDRTCGSNYTDLKTVSDSCSGIQQSGVSFASILSTGFNGNMDLSAGVVTKPDTNSELQKVDDPATSPYQIWIASGAYLQGTKVVWHHNVYEAKYYTQGDTPDNPVLQAYQTPWQLVGPVLPGEKPIKQATLPEGTYPDWVGTTIYSADQRVLFNGVPYQAKWYNVAQSPAAASSNPTGSPWTALTQSQINDVTSSN
jgi:chitinase